MGSFRFLLSRRWILFALVVVVLAYATWWLGGWQFRRLDDRKDQNSVVRTNEHRAVAPVAEVLHGHADEPDHLVIGELLLQREPVEPLGGHAVGAPEVAAVGQADPQVGGDPAVRVRERLHVTHSTFPRVGAGLG